MKKFYVKTIRKFLKKKSIRKFLITYCPKFFTQSESIYIRYKDRESNFLNIFCDKNKISLDIGALWGGYTILLSKLSEKVFVFEPNISKYNFLKSAFKKTNNVEIFNYAVSNKSDRVKFRLPKNSPGNATIEESNTLDEFESVEEYDVQTTTIDQMMFDNVGFIKIDIEGHEYSALEGMIQTLRGNRPNLLIEIEERHKTGSINKTTDLMRSLDYKMLFIIEKNLYEIDKYDIDLYQKSQNRNTNLYINNFIFIPQEKFEEFVAKISEYGIQYN